MTVNDAQFDARACVQSYDIRPEGFVVRNPNRAFIYNMAIQLNQAKVMKNGALLQDTAPYFGRAAKNTFYVRKPEMTYEGQQIDDLIDWGNADLQQFDNRPI